MSADIIIARKVASIEEGRRFDISSFANVTIHRHVAPRMLFSSLKQMALLTVENLSTTYISMTSLYGLS